LLYAQTFAQGLAVENLPGLSAFVDSTMARLMEQEHVSGGAVAIVHDGQVLLQRAYGQSDLESGQQVDVARTLFRIGSVSKLFTALAAMQLVDAGKLDLQRDLRTYLPEMPIPYGATTHQLPEWTSWPRPQRQRPDVRQMAAWALGQIEDATAVRSLTPLLKDPDTDVRVVAAWAAASLDPRAGSVPIARRRNPDMRSRKGV
jgi:CubicO group peptidase (beta-lactamase class C family)